MQQIESGLEWIILDDSDDEVERYNQNAVPSSSDPCIEPPSTSSHALMENVFKSTVDIIPTNKDDMDSRYPSPPSLASRLQSMKLGSSSQHMERIYIDLDSDSDSDSEQPSLDSPQTCLQQPCPKAWLELAKKGNDTGLHLPAGSFDVVLVIDQREVHAHKDTTALLMSRLAAEGISFIFRTLPIGDFMWICQSKKQSSPTLEVTLDYIMERKREDDLISSIVDGRFEEQKFRLMRSGFRNITYIIEKYTVAHPMMMMMQSRRGRGRAGTRGGRGGFQGRHRGFSHSNSEINRCSTTGHAGDVASSSHSMSRVEQFGKGKFVAALMSTLVQNKFFVKQTEGFDETLNYLIYMTRALSRKYVDRDIKIMPDALMAHIQTFGPKALGATFSSESASNSTFSSISTPVSTSNHQRVVNRASQRNTCDSFISPIYHFKFEDFSKLHGKNALMTHQDLYLKQLTCIRLMSPERALAITKIYPTMIRLFEAYEELNTLDSRKHLLKDVIYEPPNKRIGEKLSERVYETIFGSLS